MKPGDNNIQDRDIQDRKDQQQVEARYLTLEQAHPPAMLDQAILNKARQAVESRPVRPWNFGWMHATATTAVLVLGLTLVLQHRSEVSQPLSGQNGTVSEQSESVTVPTESEETLFLDSTAELDKRDDEAFRAPNRQESPQAKIVGATSADKKALDKFNEKLDQRAMEPAPGPDNPEDWIAAILELKRSGQVDAWQMELEMFRLAFPDYPLPEELGSQ